MVKKVGNVTMTKGSIVMNCIVLMIYFLAFVHMNANSQTDASITLKIHDMNHVEIQQAMAQAPFILQVELKNIDGQADMHLAQHIPGIENFKSSQSLTSQKAYIEQNVTTVKTFYNFVLRSDKTGNFTIGPIVLKDRRGNYVRSNRLIIPVGDEIIGHERSVQDKYFAEISLEKKRVYVGDKVDVHIKFYDRIAVDDLQIKFPEMKDVYISEQHQVRKSSIYIEGQEYFVTEWTFRLYPLQVGTLLLQDICAAFFAPTLKDSLGFAGFFEFFTSFNKSQEHLMINPVKLEVMPLPGGQHADVNTVGQFTDYSLILQDTTVAAGQGVVLEVELIGNTNFAMLPAPSLQLPLGCKVYQSNITLDEQSDNKQKFEFILQVEQEGLYTIPSQTLWYFDPVQEQYASIKSNAVQLTVTPGQVHDQQTLLLEPNNNQEESLPPDTTTLDDFPLLVGSVYLKSDTVIPFSYFNYVLISMYMFWFMIFLYYYVLRFYIFSLPFFRKRFLFYKVYRMMYKARLEKNIKQILQAFTLLFAELLHVPCGTLQGQMIRNFFEKKQIDQKTLQSWQQFYDQLLYQTFAQQEKNNFDEMYQQALTWISYLKEKA